MRRPSRAALWVGLALLLALSSLAAATLGGASAPEALILVAADDLERGELVADALAQGRARWIPLAGAGRVPGLVRTGDELEGRSLAVPLAAGEPIVGAVLGAARGIPALRPDGRVVSLPLSAAGAVAPALAPGTPVDVVGGTAEGPRAAAQVLAAEARVVRVEPETATTGAGGVILAVREDEALAISEALATGRDLRLIVRPA